MPQKLPLKDFKWIEETSQFNENFTKVYTKDSIRGYIIEADVQYPENLHNLQSDSNLLPERMKTENIEKLIASLYHKEEYIIHIRNLKQPLNQ